MTTNKNNHKKQPDNSLPGKRTLWGKCIAFFGTAIIKACAKVSYVGKENIPQEAPYVLAPNHQTYVDGLMVANGLPKGHFEHFSALIGADLKTEHGFIGKLMAPVSRGIEVERYGNPVRGLVMAYRACRAGNIIMVHPEGTRTHDGYLAPLQSGASYISIKADVPLIPVYIEGGYDFFSRHDKKPRFRNPLTKKKFDIRVVYGEPLLPGNFKNASELTEALEHSLKSMEATYLKKINGQLRSEKKS